MWLSSILNSLSPSFPYTRTRRRPSTRQRPAASRLTFEALDDRILLSFLAPMNYDAGLSLYGPNAVVTADFNGDGRLDLAGANFGRNTVSVLLGNPDGTFQPARNSDSGYYPFALAVGDFDADGKLDVVTANANDVSVLLGKGDGTFQPPSNTYIASSLESVVAVADFNADGKIDLVVVSNIAGMGGARGYASVLLGKGDGSFSGPSTTALGYGLRVSAAVADFNGDGRQDFATANYDYSTVSVLLSDGSGTLQAPTEFYAGEYPLSVAAGDVDGDGDTDLVTANPYGDSVSVLLGDGLGAFAYTHDYAAGGWSQAGAVVLGDFNKDGNLDVATANQGSYPDYFGSVIVLLGNGDSTFQPALEYEVGSQPGAVVAGDFNGDGWLDAVTANGGNDISVLINDQSWPPLLPSVSIDDVTVTEGNTGTVNATFTVSLSAADGQPVTVHFTTADGSATAGSDYTAASGDMTFAPGETSKTISVAVLGDRLGESNETFFINLDSPTNATIAGGQGMGTILDDEPRISINEVTIIEGNSGVSAFAFTVSLSAAYDVPVTVGYATANGSATAGSDYQAASGMPTIPAGQTSGTITVLVNGDRLAEPNETFFVNLSNLNYGVIADGQGIGTIVDDEPRIGIDDVTKKEGNSGTTLFVFTVTLSAAYDAPVTVNFATANGTATTADHDYQAQSGTLTFAPGETTKTITIVVYGDTKREANETFFINLSSPSSNALLIDSQGIGTILDDDHPGRK